MRRVIISFGLSCLGLLSLVAACGTGGDDTPAGPDGQSADMGVVGTGFLVVADLRDPPMPEHFTGEAEGFEGRLVLHPNGCVTVVVGGVERMPLWPDGTDVSEDPGNSSRYLVTLTTGAKLAVDESTGDVFSARGIVDDSSESFEVEAGIPTKISSFLAFCGVEARPVAFPDATTFAVRRGQRG